MILVCKFLLMTEMGAWKMIDIICKIWYTCYNIMKLDDYFCLNFDLLCTHIYNILLKQKVYLSIKYEL